MDILWFSIRTYLFERTPRPSWQYQWLTNAFAVLFLFREQMVLHCLLDMLLPLPSPAQNVIVALLHIVVLFVQSGLLWICKTAWRSILDESWGLGRSPSLRARVAPHPPTVPYVVEIAWSPSFLFGRQTVCTKALNLTPRLSLIRAMSKSQTSPAVNLSWTQILFGTISCCDASLLVRLWSPALIRYLRDS